MVNAKDIDRLKMFGLGKQAEVLGQPYKVYRPAQFTSGNYLDAANLFIKRKYVYTKVGAAKDFKDTLEASKWEGVLWYILKGDFTRCKVGDVFVLDDASYGAGKTSVSFATYQQNMFVVTSLKPTKNSIGARLNTFIKVFRPSESNDFGPSISASTPLRQIDGDWIWGAVGENAHWIPAGMMASSHTSGGKAFAGVPGVNSKPAWYAFVPSLQGFSFTEGDHLRTISGEVYSVQIAYEQQVGDSGSQLVLQREAGYDSELNPLDDFSEGNNCC